MSFEDKLISGLQSLMFIWGWIVLLFIGAFAMWLFEKIRKWINATDIISTGTFLESAFFCFEEDCEAIFELSDTGCCPVCASQSIYPLKKFLPSLEMKDNGYRLKLRMEDYNELEKLIKKEQALSLSG